MSCNLKICMKPCQCLQGPDQRRGIADLAGLSAAGRTPASTTFRTRSLRACTCSISACFSCLYFSQAASNSFRSPSSTVFRLHHKSRLCQVYMRQEGVHEG